MTRRSFHSVVAIPILDGPSKTLPVIFFDSGERAIYAARHLYAKFLEHEPPSTTYERARAIGLMYDFCKCTASEMAIHKDAGHGLLRHFYSARRTGFKPLGWTPVSADVAKREVDLITDFGDFLSFEYSHKPINQSEFVLVETLGAEAIAQWRNEKSRREKRLLGHLERYTKHSSGLVETTDFKPKGSGSRRHGIKKAFPAAHIDRFLLQTTSLRDLMCWLLIFFGGIRSSEVMHIFLQDVSLGEHGEAKVILAHPEDSLMSWTSRLGKRRHGTRAAFLMERYNRAPRNRMGFNHPEHAGWKGMSADEDKHISQVHWIIPEAGRLFWRLHVRYVKTVRGLVPDVHPYYFINERGSAFGTVLKLSNLQKAFARVVQRIGLTLSKDRGIHLHGGRHFYGYFGASVLKLPIHDMKLNLHHRDMKSTVCYYHVDPKEARDRIRTAHQRREFEAQEQMKTAEQTAVTSVFGNTPSVLTAMVTSLSALSPDNAAYS